MTQDSATTFNPQDIPADLTQANANYKKQAWLAMLGLSCFLFVYMLLLASFSYIAYLGVLAINEGRAELWGFVTTACSSLLAIFMVKSLFSVRKAGDPGGIEVLKTEEPKLFEYLNSLADEVGAPRPHRVFLTPEVNAAVFYDLSLLNFIFPSKKNLIIGLGLVNVLNKGEFKAVLAHEFGHFAQGSMLVGRWVYIAQQIISHMVATRDWLDTIVRFISRIDLRIAWIGWVLSLVIWSIRSLMDTLFSVVIIAERALSREMEFNADLVAVSVTGSDALVNALHKLQAADHAWQTSIDIAKGQASNGKRVEDLFRAQRATIDEMRRILSDKTYGATPEKPENVDAVSHRVFSEQFARPPQMWATHPANRDREDNAKARYVPAQIDTSSAWEVFSDPSALKEKISQGFYNPEKVKDMVAIAPLEAVIQRFDHAVYEPEYKGVYLGRSPVRNFPSVETMLSSGSIKASAKESLAKLYPDSLKADLELARNLDIERSTLEALGRGDLKPSGGVIRHRGEELKKSEIPQAIESIVSERNVVAERLMQHDASCRRAHLQAAQEQGQGWYEYLTSLIELLHCVEQLQALVDDENALLVNTWMVITADGKIGHFEKRRILKVCKKVRTVMQNVSAPMKAIDFPPALAEELGIDNWADQCPVFDIVPADKKNWQNWCSTASNIMNTMSGALSHIQSLTLNQLIKSEALVKTSLLDDKPIEVAPEAGVCPKEYPVLLPGNENTLQQKLDLWNRFQLAHGVFPTLARLVVSLGIVGGTIYSGMLAI